MEGRCKDCTLDAKLAGLQVLRFIKAGKKDGCPASEGEADCTLHGEKKINAPDVKAQRRT